MKSTVYALIFLLGFHTHLFAQQETCTLILKTEEVLNKHHITPPPYHVQVYHEIFNLYLESIDPEGIVYSVKDSITLHAKIEKSTSLCDVFTSTRKHLVDCLVAHDSLLKALELNYVSNNALTERFQVSCTGKLSRKADDKSLRIFAKQYYKYLFLQKTYLLQEASIVLEPERVLHAIVQKRRDYFADMISYEQALLNLYLKALCLRHDPHSAFFDANEKQAWLTHLSKDEFSFGFEIEVTENELYKVSEIIPGGAAWNSKQLEVGDVIEQMELENGRKYLVGIDSDKDIYEAFQSKQNSSMTFYVTKADGLKRKVKLAKSKVEVSENVINGYIFKKGNQRLGYIDLPAFYASDDRYAGNGCASDMGREILQLKKDSIDGLIIDLRNNGGGYMEEALAMAGLFIDEGVLALKQEKGDKPRYLKDPNRGVLYDGKLILLVNNFSASASELLAGTLQQYHRAIVVGNRTYGKATMQRMFPVDSLAEMKRMNNYYASITVGKFYMVNKKTHQAHGIQPDIHLPSIYDYLDVQFESEMPYFIKPDSVNKSLEVNLLPVVDLNSIKEKSLARMKAQQWQAKFKTFADSISYFSCPTYGMVLNQKNVFTWEKMKSNYFKQHANATIVDFKPYPVYNTSMYNQLLKSHDMYATSNTFKIDELNKDVRLFETLNILSDYITQP